MINVEGKLYNEDQIGHGEITLSFTKEGNLFHVTYVNSPLIRFYQDKILCRLFFVTEAKIASSIN